MNLRTLDLNLLVVLDALLEEAHVSRAAVRLGLSQPAVSAALQRCRLLFRDDLLERGRGTMRLTPRAEALRGPLAAVLADVRALVDPPEQPLAELRQTVRILMADSPALLMIARLQRRLAPVAPGIDLVIGPWHGAEAAQAALLAGTADLAVSVLPPLPAEFHRETLLGEHYVVAMRRDHPAADRFDRAAWLAFPHILVSGRGPTRSPVDEALAGLGLARRVGLVVPGFQMVPALLASSDMIALLPSRCVPADAGLVQFPPPVPVAGFDLHLAWHRRRSGDRAVRTVATALAAILSDDISG